MSDKLAEETEFYRRRNIPHVEVRYISGNRTFDMFLKLCGRELGSKHEVLKRGKVVSTTYHLPPID